MSPRWSTTFESSLLDKVTPMRFRFNLHCMNLEHMKTVDIQGILVV